MTHDTRTIYTCRDCGATTRLMQPLLVPRRRPGVYDPRDTTVLTVRCDVCGGIMDPDSTNPPDARKQIGLDWR